MRAEIKPRAALRLRSAIPPKADMGGRFEFAEWRPKCAAWELFYVTARWISRPALHARNPPLSRKMAINVQSFGSED